MRRNIGSLQMQAYKKELACMLERRRRKAKLLEKQNNFRDSNNLEKAGIQVITTIKKLRNSLALILSTFACLESGCARDYPLVNARDKDKQCYTVSSPKTFQSNIDENVDRTKKWVLLIVDMQDVFWQRIEDSDEKELENYIHVIRHCAQHAIPIIVLTKDFSNGDASPVIDEISHELEQIPAEQVYHISRVDSNSGFANPNLETYLHSMHADSVFIMGAFGPLCVKDTAIDANLLGFTVGTSRQVIGSEDVSSLFNTSRDNSKGAVEFPPMVPPLNVGFYMKHGIYSDNYVDFLKTDKDQNQPLLHYAPKK